jgi:hypothetical protein
MKRIALIALSSSLIYGCAPDNSSDKNRESKAQSILDDAAARTDLSEEWALADRDLSSDIWSVHPKAGRTNDSRLQRQTALTQKLLAAIRPKMERMSALELLNSLKLEGAITRGGRDSMVVFYVWCDGNAMIIEELKRRPKSDLEVLRSFKDDSRVLVTGESGEYMTVGSVVHRVLGDTVGSSDA